MAQVNTRTPPRARVTTHEGGPARGDTTLLDQLKRSVSSCMLWDSTFYESGESIADRITTLTKQLCAKGKAADVAALAVHARSRLNLRHVGLLLCRVMAKEGALDKRTLSRCIQRPDELCEFLALYWHDGEQPLSCQVKKGLRYACRQFDTHQWSKYNNTERAIKLRDVVRLVHPSPKDVEDETVGDTWRRMSKGSLKGGKDRETVSRAQSGKWESQAAAGKDLKTVFEGQLRTGKLGALALIKNLRKMEELGIDRKLVEANLAKANVRRVLPYRFIQAAKHAPHMEHALQEAMFRATRDQEKLPGDTIILVDVSQSMFGGSFGGVTANRGGAFHPAWAKAPRGRIPQARNMEELTRFEAATALAMIAREMCDDCRVIGFSTSHCEVPPRRGFALRDAIRGLSCCMGGTQLGAAVRASCHALKDEGRLIVITDEQSHDPVPNPPAGIRGYMVNVAPHQFGVGYGPWVHVDGFSEYVLKYIHATEQPGSGVNPGVEAA